MLGVIVLGRRTLLDIPPNNMEEDMQATTRVARVLDHRAQRGLSVSSVDMSARVVPDGLRRGALTWSEAISALGQVQPWMCGARQASGAGGRK